MCNFTKRLDFITPATNNNPEKKDRGTKTGQAARARTLSERSEASVFKLVQKCESVNELKRSRDYK